jgi:hypothetical protein
MLQKIKNKFFFLSVPLNLRLNLIEILKQCKIDALHFTQVNIIDGMLSHSVYVNLTRGPVT